MVTVGQELWHVPSDRRWRDKSCTVRVTKVGRKWAQLDNGDRIDVQTLRVDCGQYSSSGRCWLSEADWRKEESRQQAWRDLRTFIDRKYQAPEGVTEMGIRQALTIVAGLPGAD